ncbi:MAG: hypothetical protein ACKN9W_05885 [Methylococcus sp.]
MSTEELMKCVEADDRWDTGALGRDMRHAKAASLTPAEAETISAAVGLQMISIRLPNQLIDDFKFIADTQGLRYQTLMRQVLARFADCELKQMARQAATEQLARIKQEEAG